MLDSFASTVEVQEQQDLCERLLWVAKWGVVDAVDAGDHEAAEEWRAAVRWLTARLEQILPAAREALTA